MAWFWWGGTVELILQLWLIVASTRSDIWNKKSRIIIIHHHPCHISFQKITSFIHPSAQQHTSKWSVVLYLSWNEEYSNSINTQKKRLNRSSNHSTNRIRVQTYTTVRTATNIEINHLAISNAFWIPNCLKPNRKRFEIHALLDRSTRTHDLPRRFICLFLP